MKKTVAKNKNGHHTQKNPLTHKQILNVSPFFLQLQPQNLPLNPSSTPTTFYLIKPTQPTHPQPPPLVLVCSGWGRLVQQSNGILLRYTIHSQNPHDLKPLYPHTLTPSCPHTSNKTDSLTTHITFANKPETKNLIPPLLLHNNPHDKTPRPLPNNIALTSR